MTEPNYPPCLRTWKHPPIGSWYAGYGIHGLGIMSSPHDNEAEAVRALCKTHGFDVPPAHAKHDTEPCPPPPGALPDTSDIVDLSIGAAEPPALLPMQDQGDQQLMDQLDGLERELSTGPRSVTGVLASAALYGMLAKEREQAKERARENAQIERATKITEAKGHARLDAAKAMQCWPFDASAPRGGE